LQADRVADELITWKAPTTVDLPQIQKPVITEA
jgi:hypothetical protein